MIFNPQPKRPPIKLDRGSKEWAELKDKVCMKEFGHCQICHCYCLKSGECHHIKTRGAGGDDSFENLQWVCRNCHPD